MLRKGHGDLDNIAILWQCQIKNTANNSKTQTGQSACYGSCAREATFSKRKSRVESQSNSIDRIASFRCVHGATVSKRNSSVEDGKVSGRFKYDHLACIATRCIVTRIGSCTESF